MKRFLTILLALLCVLSLLSCEKKEEKDDEEITETEGDDKIYAPDFDVYDGDANKLSLSDFRGRPVILNFWATWCPPCKAEMPHFENAFKEYGGEIEFMMVNLTDGSRDTVDGVKEFIREQGYTFPVYYDTTYSASVAYGVSSIPATVFINADGTVFTAATGALSEATLQKYIDSFLENNK